MLYKRKKVGQVESFDPTRLELNNFKQTYTARMPTPTFYCSNVVASIKNVVNSWTLL